MPRTAARAAARAPATAGRAAGIQQYGASTAHIDNSIVAGNLNDDNLETDVVGLINTASSNNVFTNAAYPNVNGQLAGDWKTVIKNDGTVPLLGDNGGLVRTVALEPGSVAIDNGNDALAVDEAGAALTTDAMAFKPKATAKYRRPIPKYPC